MQILLISDIHANFPALEAVAKYFRNSSFDRIINCGDSVVYGPFPNETLSWLASRSVLSILGNTDKKVIKLLQGKDIAKPKNPEKKIMYTWTADQLSSSSANYLQSFEKKDKIAIQSTPLINGGPSSIGIFHGSPAKNHEFLFNTSPDSRFIELAALTEADIIVCGHSHDPFHKYLGGKHFINPGSTGRMFDGNPQPSCATLKINKNGIVVQHHRISYDVEKTVAALRRAGLPDIYCTMYRQGRKTN